MFDFDGVIVDSLDDQCRAFVETLQANGLEHLATQACFLDFTETNWFEALAEAGVPEGVVAEIEDAFGAAPSPELSPRMAEVIGRLGAAHPVVVITSISPRCRVGVQSVSRKMSSPHHDAQSLAAPGCTACHDGVTASAQRSHGGVDCTSCHTGMNIRPR